MSKKTLKPNPTPKGGLFLRGNHFPAPYQGAVYVYQTPKGFEVHKSFIRNGQEISQVFRFPKKAMKDVEGLLTALLSRHRLGEYDVYDGITREMLDRGTPDRKLITPRGAQVLSSCSMGFPWEKSTITLYALPTSAEHGYSVVSTGKSPNGEVLSNARVFSRKEAEKAWASYNGFCPTQDASVYKALRKFSDHLKKNWRSLFGDRRISDMEHQDSPLESVLLDGFRKIIPDAKEAELRDAFMRMMQELSRWEENRFPEDHEDFA